MQHLTVFLLDFYTITLISLCTDCWILIKIRPIDPPPGCRLNRFRQHSILKCDNQSYILLEEYAGLLRQCNELTEGYRQQIVNARKLYNKPCYWFISDVDSTWRHIESDWGMDIFAILTALGSMITNLLSIKEHLRKKPKNASNCLLTASMLYAVPVIITIRIIHSTNTRIPKNEFEQMIFLEAGWSLVAAILSIGLMLCASYSAHRQHKKMVERKESERRRRQIHNAIMSHCRQDIAMAIRARMTVI